MRVSQELAGNVIVAADHLPCLKSTSLVPGASRSLTIHGLDLKGKQRQTQSKFLEYRWR